jgi:xylulokinase
VLFSPPLLSIMSALFLGLDLSTQALKATLLSSSLAVLSEESVRFDLDLPHYGTKGGTLQDPSGSGIVYSPVMMLIEAMDLIMERIKRAAWPVHRIRGVSAAGQQHASIYWSHAGPSILSTIDSKKTLASQLQAAFSRAEVPNWQDSSTLAECSQLEKALGGASTLAALTGSRAHTRFTGPQIMRFISTQPQAYHETSRISLVSSFVTTLLCLDGQIKGIDESDACGMNMWTISTAEREWNERILGAIAGDNGIETLAEKLGEVECDGGRVVGHIGRWFVERYGFNSDCIVCPGTGDNSATFLFFSLRQNEALVSLGSSDVVLVSTSTYAPHLDYHTFVHPAQLVRPPPADRCDKAVSGMEDAMRYFNMLVYKNGSLAREHIRDRYFHSSWTSFNAAVETSRSRHAEDLCSQLGFYWLKPDMIPANASGIHRYTSSSDSSGAKQATRVAEYTPPSDNAVAILTSQMLNYKSRASSILAGQPLQRVFATGGASSNSTICSIMADVLGCDVCKPVSYDEEEEEWHFADWNACSAGAAYKAAWSWHRHVAETTEEQQVDFDAFVRRCLEERKQQREQRGVQSGSVKGPRLLEEGVAILAHADDQKAMAYDRAVEWWRALETRAMQERQQDDVALCCREM